MSSSLSLAMASGMLSAVLASASNPHVPEVTASPVQLDKRDAVATIQLAPFTGYALPAV